jgi:hypothetical protein
MGAARVFAAAAGSDDSDFLRFHKITLPVCGLLDEQYKDEQYKKEALAKIKDISSKDLEKLLFEIGSKRVNNSCSEGEKYNHEQE